MVEWLEQLGYDAESRRIARVRGSAAPCGTGKLSLSTQQKMGTFFELEKDKAAKERDGFRLSSAVPKIQWDSNPHCPYGYYATGHLYLFTKSIVLNKGMEINQTRIVYGYMILASRRDHEVFGDLDHI